MFAYTIAIAAAVLLTPQSVAQEYTVLSSIILTRTGERTPAYYGNIPTTLTSLGANQAYHQGQYFRSRYLTSSATSNGVDGAPIYNIDPNFLSGSDLYIAALDQQWNVATAQAFLQGLYPPYASPVANSSIPSMQSSTGLLANNSYIDAPLNGYQYAQIHAFDGDDSNYLYLSGNLNCPAYNDATHQYYTSSDFWATSNSTSDLYKTVGDALLQGVVKTNDLNYKHAYQIYDYLNYMNNHDNHSAIQLSNLYDPSTNVTDLSTLRWLADKQQHSKLANLTAKPSLPNNLNGTVSTIAGNMFASFLLRQFSSTIFKAQQSPTSSYPKLTLLFADHHPFTSFFPLIDLSSSLFGLPNFASSLVFELFTYQNLSTSQFPSSTSDLWLRFYFRNGTDLSSSPYQSFPLFGNSPSNTDLTWGDFVAGMKNIALDNVEDWCNICGATSSPVFCAAAQELEGNVGLGSPAVRARMAAIGAVGALLALILVGGLACGMAICGGYRFQKVGGGRKEKDNERREGGKWGKWGKGRKGGLGGFKGGDKNASDRDLVLPDKGGISVGITVEREVEGGGHERVGSWEMKKTKTTAMENGNSVRGLSLEEQREVECFGKPVQAVERV